MARRDVAARRSGIPPEVVREAAELVDLAISRCRAGRYVDGGSRDRVLTILRIARQDLRQIFEEPDADTDLDVDMPGEFSGRDYPAHSGSSPVRNGQDQVAG